jgi:hypothetical protein
MPDAAPRSRCCEAAALLLLPRAGSRRVSLSLPGSAVGVGEELRLPGEGGRGLELLLLGDCWLGVGGGVVSGMSRASRARRPRAPADGGRTAAHCSSSCVGTPSC